jgi:aryl-alcohol dehydrogenase-like predicted oxidoreductase
MMAASCQLLARPHDHGQAVRMTDTTNTAQPTAAAGGAALPAAAAGTFAIGGDLPVARLGFGTMRLPIKAFIGPVRDPEDGIAVLRRAVELGVNHIDTASFYRRGDVVANELVRRALSPYPDGLVIATKVGPLPGPDGHPSLQATPDQLRGLVEENLSELGSDRLDLVYLRVGGRNAPGGEPIAERFAALAKLRDEGLIRHLGISNVDAAQLAEARDIAPVAAVQNAYHVQATDDALLAECTRTGIAFVPFFPLGGGFDPIDTARLEKTAARHRATVQQVALAALLAASPVMLPIPGTGSLAHLEENVGAASVRLTPEDLAELAG